MPSVGFEPKISAGERPQTYALDRAATGTGHKGIIQMLFVVTNLDTGLQLYKGQRALRQTEGNTDESLKYHNFFFNCFVIETSIQVSEVLLQQAV
jgi:hypothetical protein